MEDDSPDDLLHETIDPLTGATTLVAQVPDMFIVFHSTAVDPFTGDLYAIDQEHGDLYRIDVGTGDIIHVGHIGVYWITGADFDPVSGDLYVCIGGLDDSGMLYIEANAAERAAALAWWLGNLQRGTLLDDLERKGRQELDLYVSHLSGQLNRYAFLPALLAHDFRLQSLLLAPGNVDQQDQVNRLGPLTGRPAEIAAAVAASGQRHEANNREQAGWRPPGQNSFVSTCRYLER